MVERYIAGYGVEPVVPDVDAARLREASETDRGYHNLPPKEYRGATGKSPRSWYNGKLGNK